MFIFCRTLFCAHLLTLISARWSVLRRQGALNNSPPRLYRSEAFAEDLVDLPSTGSAALAPRQCIAVAMAELGRAMNSGLVRPWPRPR